MFECEKNVNNETEKATRKALEEEDTHPGKLRQRCLQKQQSDQLISLKNQRESRSEKNNEYNSIKGGDLLPAIEFRWIKSSVRQEVD